MSQKQKIKLFIILYVTAMAIAVIYPNRWFILLILGLTLLALYQLWEAQASEVSQLLQKQSKQYSALETSWIRQGNQFQLLMAVLPEPLCFIDRKGTIVYHNEAFSHLNHSAGVTITSMNDPQLSFDLRMILRANYLKEKYVIRQEQIDQRQYQVTHVPVNKQQRYDGALILFQDVTTYIEAQRMQKRFLADASHELKTPVTAIKGMLEILLRPGFDDEQTRTEFLEQINKENERLRFLVNDLVTASRLSLNQLALHKTWFAVNDLASSLSVSFRNALERKNNTLILDGDASVRVFADQTRLLQVLTNLVDNADKHTLNGIIKLQWLLNQDELMISVCDNGSGISEDDLPHIFERFYRGSKARTRDQGGSGLGLAIAREIVEAHGGSLEVNSILGKGSTFVIRLKQEA